MTHAARLEGGTKASQKAVTLTQSRLGMASIGEAFREIQKRRGMDLVNDSI